MSSKMTKKYTIAL